MSRRLVRTAGISFQCFSEYEGTHIFIRVRQLMPRLHIRGLHELLCQFGRCISTRFFHSGDESLRLC